MINIDSSKYRANLMNRRKVTVALNVFRLFIERVIDTGRIDFE